MAEEIKDLIAKIQQEGVKVAEDKARQIEIQAKEQAEQIIAQAKAEAENILREAKENISRRQESSAASLRQAARDMLLELRREMERMLEKLILTNVQEALSPEETGKIIIHLIKEAKEKEGLVITLNKEVLGKLEKSVLSQLSDKVKAGVALRPSEDILAGFIISYDQAKSHFDFSDKALAEYIASSIKPKLIQILQQAVVDE